MKENIEKYMNIDRQKNLTTRKILFPITGINLTGKINQCIKLT